MNVQLTAGRGSIGLGSTNLVASAAAAAAARGAIVHTTTAHKVVNVLVFADLGEVVGPGNALAALVERDQRKRAEKAHALVLERVGVNCVLLEGSPAQRDAEASPAARHVLRRNDLHGIVADTTKLARNGRAV